MTLKSILKKKLKEEIIEEYMELRLKEREARVEVVKLNNKIRRLKKIIESRSKK